MLPYLVVSDATPLIHLFRVGESRIVQCLFRKIATSSTVMAEFTANGGDMAFLSSVVQVHPDPANLSPLSSHLHRGERTAISLYLELKADLLWIDDGDAILHCRQINVKWIRTGKVLILAKSAGIIPEVRPVLDAMMTYSNFFCGQSVRADILRDAGELNMISSTSQSRGTP